MQYVKLFIFRIYLMFVFMTVSTPEIIESLDMSSII